MAFLIESQKKQKGDVSLLTSSPNASLISSKSAATSFLHTFNESNNFSLVENNLLKELEVLKGK